IVENAVNNLTYPLCHLQKLNQTKVAYWGHGKDRSIEKLSFAKLLSENLKLLLARTSDGFFAYTKDVKLYLQKRGMSPEKIFVVNNSIDIQKQRKAFDKWRPQRDTIKKELGTQNKKVLLFVGRFTSNKRIEFLLESFSILQNIDNHFHLILVGSGGEDFLKDKPKNISYLGPIVSIDKLASIYVASDVFAFPGSVGLGPLQALCYDLPVITIHSTNHMPEIEYLSQANSMMLETSTTPKAYADAIYRLFKNPENLNSLKESIWPSIEHLTIEQMANNFIHGVNTILGL
ncbi:MAG: glycosyltransferase family 4 protein, partial [Deltaproteobacteria bacterium]|nr:glycosyltransferase family 4 protein [Deltaproteobacteria bacterium]